MTAMAPPPKPAKPPLAAKPGRTVVYRALCDYKAASSEELSYEEDDLIFVADRQSSEGWVTGRIGNSTGRVQLANLDDVLTPLHDAAKRGNIELTRDCLNNKVSANALDKSGSTPLFWAAHSGSVDVLQLLLQLPDIYINAQNKMGDTPLHAAAWKGHAQCVELLLEKGADMKIKNLEGKTAATIASNADVQAILNRQTMSTVTKARLSKEYASSDDEGSD